MQIHEREPHKCPEDCEACKALREGNHDIFVESARRKYSPPNATQDGSSTPVSSTSEPASSVPLVPSPPAPHDARSKQTETEARSDGSASRPTTPSLSSGYVSQSLYNKLSEDQEKMQEGMVVPLPRHPVVHEILDMYLKQVNSETVQTLGINVDQIAAMIRGLEAMFNVALGRTLLYKDERTQYAHQLELRRQMRIGAEPAMFYGAEHLTRMLVWIPEFMIGVNEMNAPNRELVIKISSNVLAFISSHLHEFWTSSYTRADSNRSHAHRH